MTDGSPATPLRDTSPQHQSNARPSEKEGASDSRDVNVSPAAAPPSSSANTPLLFSQFLVFALSFSVCESALVVSVSLAARLFGPTGSACVGAMYVSYAVGTLLAGQAVRWTSGGKALQPSLVLGQGCLVPFHLAGLWAVVSSSERAGGDDGGTASEDVRVDGLVAATLALGASVAGAAAGIAWAAAGAFITNSAVAMSEASDVGSRTDRLPPDNAEGFELVGRLRNEEEEEEVGKNEGRSSKTDDFYEDEVAAQSLSVNINQGERCWCRRLPLVEALLRTDFRSLAGNLTGLFNVVLLLAIFGGHIWSARSLEARPDEDGGDGGGDGGERVRHTYAVICASGVVGVAMMVCCVRDPESERTNTGAPAAAAAAEPDESSGENGVLPAERGRNASALARVVSDVIVAFKTPQLAALAGTHLASGFMEGLLLCYVGGRLINDPANIGVLAGVKTAASAVSAPVFALLGNSARFGRANVLVVGAVAYLGAAMAVLRVARRADALADDSYDDMTALLLVYALAGVGFSTWQGTAGGAFLSEIAAYISKDEARSGSGGANATVAAAFSASKALSGSATALAFFTFSREGLRYPLIVGLCSAVTFFGLLQVVVSKRRGVWKALEGEVVGPRDGYGSIQVPSHLD